MKTTDKLPMINDIYDILANNDPIWKDVITNFIEYVDQDTNTIYIDTGVSKYKLTLERI